MFDSCILHKIPLVLVVACLFTKQKVQVRFLGGIFNFKKILKNPYGAMVKAHHASNVKISVRFRIRVSFIFKTPLV
jgi:hypothetical protein